MEEENELEILEEETDELLTHVRDAMKETPYMEDEVNINSMRDHRFELRDLSASVSKTSS